jgi:FAD/FMN-containing dehydrogenase
MRGVRLVDASRHETVALHFNKGLAGAPEEAVRRAADTATGPAVLDAFALAIIAAGGKAGDEAAARRGAEAVDAATASLAPLAPARGSYVSESNYFNPDWAKAFWGGNYPRLLAAKRKYDPEGLFFARHGVGSEDWSPDGFTRL